MIQRLAIWIAMLTAAVAASAQASVGGWEIFTAFSEVTEIVDAGSKVYYMSGASGTANLFSYDKESDESYAYNNGNKLNDMGISMIRYNPWKKYLVVAYSSANIDIITDDGRVINMPDIANAVLSTRKEIRYIGFDPENDNIFVGTNFGLVRFNDERFEVAESGMYDTPVDLVNIVGDYVVIRNNNTLKYIGRDKSIARMAEFRVMPYQNVVDLRPLDNGAAAVLTGQLASGARTLYIAEFDFENAKVVSNEKKWPIGISTFRDVKDGYTMYSQTWNVKVDKADGALSPAITLPDSRKGVSCVDADLKEMWSGSADGVSSYSLSLGADNKYTVTVNRDNMRPSPLTLPTVMQMTVGADGRIYMGEYGFSMHMPSGTSQKGIVNVIMPDGTIRDLTTHDTGTDSWHMGKICPDPEDPGTYWYSFLWYTAGGQAVVKARDGEIVTIFNKDNKPADWIDGKTSVQAMDFDGKHNLWATVSQNSNMELMMLPADKTRLDNADPSAWVTYPRLGTGTLGLAWDTNIVACKHSDAVIVVGGGWDYNLHCYNTRGTATTADDVAMVVTKYIDQDGKEFSRIYLTCIVEDLKGRVWVGTDNGIFEITDPDTFTTVADSRINHLKVPRNDGTGFADYLLDTQHVTSIAVDGLNRKWIGTKNSGVYLVSEDGREILEHFTSDNSPLPTDDVFSVACDPNSNMVYFGTVNGLVAYSSTSSPAADSYDNVYAYPNPVRPEYTGWITITGLMDNSLVKIADAQGSVLYTGRSEGGMMTWDGCNSNGERVRTGVYYVFASQNGDSGSSAAVTKILVVN